MDAQMTQAAPVMTTEIVKKPSSLLSRCEPLMTAISPLIAVLSFVSGTWFSAHQLRQTTAETRAADWRSALQKVGFDEANLVPTAFLMESFDDDPNFKGQARQIEQTVLEQTGRPENFDLIFGNMMSNVRTAEDVNGAIEVGRSLGEELYGLWKMAAKGTLSGNEPKTFEYFLRRPERFYEAPGQKTQLERAYVVLWELDTFSQNLSCVVDGSQSDCSHVDPKTLNLDRLMVVNYPLPGVTATVRQMTTCRVHRDVAESAYACDDAV